jgi:predicted nucleic acid-binding protein
VSRSIETVVLDCEGLSAWIAHDRKILAMFQVFHEMGSDLVVSANTIVEVSHPQVNLPRLQWALSREKVEPVTEQAAKEAARLLKNAGLHGHKYAIDATVAEAALRQEDGLREVHPGPPVRGRLAVHRDLDRVIVAGQHHEGVLAELPPVPGCCAAPQAAPARRNVRRTSNR